jgi:hypothetical protein
MREWGGRREGEELPSGSQWKEEVRFTEARRKSTSVATSIALKSIADPIFLCAAGLALPLLPDTAVFGFANANLHFSNSACPSLSICPATHTFSSYPILCSTLQVS